MTQGPAARRWETLSAYVDEALDAAAMAAVDGELRRDAETVDDLLALRRQANALRGWAAAVTERPVPPGVSALLQRARAVDPGMPSTVSACPAAATRIADAAAQGMFRAGV